MRQGNGGLALTTVKRESIYDREWKRYGMVPCYVCGGHVKRHSATLEHIIPRSKGGSDSGRNLAISHRSCNSEKGAKIVLHRAVGAKV